MSAPLSFVGAERHFAADQREVLFTARDERGEPVRFRLSQSVLAALCNDELTDDEQEVLARFDDHHSLLTNAAFYAWRSDNGRSEEYEITDALIDEVRSRGS